LFQEPNGDTNLGDLVSLFYWLTRRH